jgi:hypothetical protein
LLVEPAFGLNLEEMVFDDACNGSAHDEVVVVIAVDAIDFFAAQNFERSECSCLKLHPEPHHGFPANSFARRFVMDGVHGVCTCPLRLRAYILYQIRAETAAIPVINLMEKPGASGFSPSAIALCVMFDEVNDGSGQGMHTA